MVCKFGVHIQQGDGQAEQDWPNDGALQSKPVDAANNGKPSDVGMTASAKIEE